MTRVALLLTSLFAAALLLARPAAQAQIYVDVSATAGDDDGTP